MKDRNNVLFIDRDGEASKVFYVGSDCIPVHIMDKAALDRAMDRGELIIRIFDDGSCKLYLWNCDLFGELTFEQVLAAVKNAAYPW